MSENYYFENVYFIIGTAYAGKSTMVKELAKRHNGIACEENYHDNYPRKQDVKKVYRKHNVEYILEDCVYTEDWNMESIRGIKKYV